jgi:26S proteasome regulatory subunit N13
LSVFINQFAIMSVMFAAPSGGRPTNGNLYEFKAGKAKLEPGSGPDRRKVVADKTKGTVYIKQTPDQLMHFGWKNRESGSDDIDLIVFPGDTEFIKIKECSDARMFMLKFKNTSDDRRLFWLQEPFKDKDEEIVKKVNDFLNNPPPQRTSARGVAGSERGNALLASLGGNSDGMGALNNMDQNQLMQLFSLMQGGNGSDMLPLSLGNNRGVEKDGAIDDPSSSNDQIPGQIPVAPQSIGNPDVGTPLIPGGKKQPRIKADQLRSIISSLNPGQSSSDNKSGTPSTSGRGLRAPLELTDVINRANVSDIVNSNAERLIPHLPDQEPIKKDEKELKETLNTPQFRKATSEFGHALQTGQMAPVLSAFELPQEAVNAAQSGNILEFAKKLTASEAGTKEDIDAQINADAEAQETTESAIQEPSAKKGKTDDDHNMELD